MLPLKWQLLGLAVLGLWGLGGCTPSVTSPTGNSTVASADPADSLGLEHAAWELPAQAPHDGFLSSQACQRCHQKSHQSWHRTFHRTMTQIASKQSVLAPFDGRKLTRNGTSCAVEQHGDEFWVTVPDPDVVYQRTRNKKLASAAPPQMVQRQVVLVTGSHHMQIYWLPSHDSNELRIFPWVFFIDEQRWIPYEDSFVAPPNYGPMLANWNGNCIACHSLDGKPNYNFQTRRFKTEVVEFGISCEACHGPGEAHIRWHEDQRALAEKGVDPILHPGNVPSKLSAEVCGQCHSDFIRESDYYTAGPKYRAGGDLDAAQKTIDFEMRKDPRHPFHDSHWEDGTARVGGREYQGLVASSCFQKGELTCITCHSMHEADPNQQLTLFAQGIDVCLQCHQSIAQDVAAHTHHAADSSGSECYNCHMPRTSIALFRAMRSHRIDSPSAATSLTTGRPNACNLCHLDKSLAWTAEHLHEWYGKETREIPSTSPTDLPKNVAAAIQWLLMGDAAQRFIAAWHFGWQPAQNTSGAGWEAPLLAQLLNDPYSAVRLVAGRSLKSLPHMTELQYDFLAADQERNQKILRAVQLWGERSTAAENPDAVLQQQSGQLNEQAIRRFLQLQNRRPITITE